jgi:hypothetical protein
MAKHTLYLLFVGFYLFCCDEAAFPARPQVTSPPGPESSPSYYAVDPAFEYSNSAEILLDVDFRNMELNIFGPDGHVRVRAKLKNGIFGSTGKTKDWIAVNGISYFDFGDQKPRFALVSFLWDSTGARADSHGGVQLFTIENKWLTVVQQILFSTKHFGAGAIFDSATRTLLINSSHHTRLDPHCCPSQQDVVRFDWKGNKFAQAASKTLPVARPGNLQIR